MIIKPRRNKRPLYVALSIILVLLLSSLAYSYQNNLLIFSGKGSPAPSDTINLDPPTDEEKQAGDDRKKEIINEETSEEAQVQLDDSQDKQKVDVVIVDAGQYDNDIEVRAFIPDHIQKGTCTTTFKKGVQSVTKEAPAVPDARTTICTNPEFTRSDFPSSGEWTVTVSYASQDAAGQSETRKVTIQ